MPTSKVNGLSIHWERRGDPEAPAIVLVMGFSMQMTAWPESFCDDLAADGFQVIRFDNRDIGLSERLDDLGQPAIPALIAQRMSGWPPRAPYSLADMADDTVALLDELGIDQAHVVGASMGGMIAQRIAIGHPGRVRSLTSIMSTTGDLRHAWPHWSVAQMVLAPPRVDDLETRLRYGVEFWKAVGSPGDPPPVEEVEADVRSWYERAPDLSGRDRQLAAIIADGNRTRALRNVEVESLVMHGKADPLVPFAGGRATAAALPHVRFVPFDGMGHDLRPRYLAPMTDEILALARRTERSGSRRGGR